MTFVTDVCLHIQTRSYWISWNNGGTVAVGLCSDPTQKNILTADLLAGQSGSEENMRISANFIQISTTSGINGFWMFPSGNKQNTIACCSILSYN